MTDVTAAVRAHLHAHFARAGTSTEPDVATVTFVGVPPIDVLRFGPDSGGLIHFVSLGGSRQGDGTPTEVVVSLRGPSIATGIARSVAVLAAAPAVEGLIPVPGALVDLGQPTWKTAPFTAFLLGDSEIEAVRRGAVPAGDPGHSQRGGMGAAQRRERDAAGVAGGRRRRT